MPADPTPTEKTSNLLADALDHAHRALREDQAFLDRHPPIETLARGFLELRKLADERWSVIRHLEAELADLKARAAAANGSYGGAA